VSNSATTHVAKLERPWVGGDYNEARLQERRARDAGLSVARARVVGNIGSMRDCWAFRNSIAKIVRVSVRTVQRAITQAKELGLIEVHRAKKKEVPPGLENPLPCGWSHRWATSRGMGNARAQEAIAAARIRAAMRRAAAPVLQGTARRRRGMTGPELEARRAFLRAQAAELVAAERETPEPPD
jgi:hypothetical protein